MVGKNHLASFLFVLVGLISRSHQQAFCTEDFSPCSCSADDLNTNDWTVRCDQVPMNDVLAVFTRTNKIDLLRVELTLSSTEDTIPANILSNKQSAQLAFACLHNQQLKIDQRAFTTSQGTTQTLAINFCDLSQQSFAYLTGFIKLRAMSFFSTANLQADFNNLPMLNSLDYLTINNSTGINQLQTFPSLARGLITFFIGNNVDMNDATMDRFMTWISTRSTDTLESLTINGNRLTRIPASLGLFQKLNYFSANTNNFASIITTGLLSFSTQVRLIYLAQAGVTAFQAGAFSGNKAIPFGIDFGRNFEGAVVSLSANNLNRFDESVFKFMLQDMVNANGGFVDLDSNPMDCSNLCNFAWLIRDNPAMFDHVYNGRCSDGTAFEDIDLNEFNGCF